MKTKIITALIAIATTAQAQTYYFSGTGEGGGYFDMYLTDRGSGAWCQGGYFFPRSIGTECSFYVSSETVYLDTVANTIRQVGTIQVSPVITGGTVNDTGSDGIPATLSLNFGVVNGGVIPFDTGAVPYWGPYDLQGYTHYGIHTSDLQLPAISFDGSYVWTTGGTTHSGAFDYSVGFGMALFRDFELPSPTTMNLSFPEITRGQVITRTVVTDFDFYDHDNLYVYPGSAVDGALYAGWGGSITATIPEPGSLTILSCGFVGIAFSRRGKRAPR